MPVPITHYVDVSVSLEGSVAPPATFGTPMFVHQHSLESARLAGPFSSVADVLDAGHASGSPPALFAAAVAAQQPRARQFYIGRADAGDADYTETLDAIEAEDAASWYCAHIESRDDADIQALAAWIEARRKIAVAQSNAASLLAGEGPTYTLTFGGTETDGDYDVTFTGFGLASPQTVTVTRATTPATNDDLATAMDAELDTQTGGGGDIEGVLALVSSAGSVVTIRVTDGLIGTITTDAPGSATLIAEVTDADIGTFLQSNNYTRTALVYSASDTAMLAEAWASRCLAFNLDVRKGGWAYKRLNGQAGATLTSSEAQALRNANMNYFAEAVASSGVAIQAFTAQGWMPSGAAAAGRRIDVTTTLDWMNARFEEALMNVLLQEPNWVPYSNSGIRRFKTAANDVLARALRAEHLVPFIPPTGQPDEGVQTPYISVPKLSATSTTERQNRELTMGGVGYLTAGIEKVIFNLEVRQ